MRHGLVRLPLNTVRGPGLRDAWVRRTLSPSSKPRSAPPPNGERMILKFYPKGNEAPSHGPRPEPLTQLQGRIRQTGPGTH
jgi:hypothetical protein